jgi:hypothetical protein
MQKLRTTKKRNLGTEVLLRVNIRNFATECLYDMRQ